jgi:purine-binding chemotaxis protein CheW
VETSFVREIHPLTDLTPLPCTPAFVLGVVNLRGEIVSLIDVKKFFDLPEKGLTDLNKVIVLQSATMRFGILADAVLGVRRVPAAEIQPSLPTLTGIREQYLKGVTAGRTVILDAEKLLGDEKIVVQEQVEG